MLNHVDRWSVVTGLDQDGLGSERGLSLMEDVVAVAVVVAGLARLP